eukprot:scaffold80_cov115-Cylindrotheca_fusiformis.AAC.2
MLANNKTLVTTLPRRENYFVDPNQEVIMGSEEIKPSCPAARFSILGVAGITVDLKNLAELQSNEKGSKSHSCLSSPSKMQAVVSISKNGHLLSHTDLSHPLQPSRGIKSETTVDRYVALWTNEQEMSLGSQMDLHMNGTTSFDLTIGLTGESLPAMPIGIATVSFNEDRMRGEGTLATLLDIPIRKVDDSQMIFLNSYSPTTSSKKQKKKRWFAKGVRGPEVQRKAFQSIYSTDTSGGAIMRVQIQLKPTDTEQIETPLKAVKHCIVDLDESIADSEEEEVPSEQADEPRIENEDDQISTSEQADEAKIENEVTRTSTEETKFNREEEEEEGGIDADIDQGNLGDSRDSVGASETNHSDARLEEDQPSNEDKGISKEEYQSIHKLAESRTVVDDNRKDTSDGEIEEEQSSPREAGTEENKLSTMFRDAMDLAISNFFGGGKVTSEHRSTGTPTTCEQEAATGAYAESSGAQESPEDLPNVQRKGRKEPYPPVPTLVVTRPGKSLQWTDDDTFTMTATESFNVEPEVPVTEVQHPRVQSVPEGKESDSPPRAKSPLGRLSFRVMPSEVAVPITDLLGCGKYDDALTFEKQDDKDKRKQRLEISKRVPEVIVDYDLQSTTNEELTLESRDFPPQNEDWEELKESSILRRPKYSGNGIPKAIGGSGKCLSRQPRRLVTKRPNRTVGPDDESTASEDSLDSLGSAIDQMELKVFRDGEESQIDTNVKDLIAEECIA